MLYQSNKIKKFLFALVIPMFLVTLPVVAQSGNNSSQYTLVQQSQSQSRQSQQFQDKELKKFAEIMKSIQQIQVESNQEVKEAFSESSLTQQRFNTLYTARKEDGSKKA